MTNLTTFFNIREHEIRMAFIGRRDFLSARSSWPKVVPKVDRRGSNRQHRADRINRQRQVQRSNRVLTSHQTSMVSVWEES